MTSNWDRIKPLTEAEARQLEQWERRPNTLSRDQRVKMERLQYRREKTKAKKGDRWVARDGPDDKGAIDVTPEMVRAGLDVLAAWEDSEDYRAENLVTDLFRAMVLAGRRNYP